jgi:hypothetical protein
MHQARSVHAAEQVEPGEMDLYAGEDQQDHVQQVDPVPYPLDDVVTADAL